MTQDIDTKLKLLQPVLGTVKSMKLRMMYHFEDDARAKREIENRIDLLISRLVKTKIEDEIILPPPDKSACTGDIKIGDVTYLNRTICQFSLKIKDLMRHMAILGSTGSGKTNMAHHLISQLRQKGIPFLIIDWETSYRSLKKAYPDVEVFTVGKNVNPLHLNPLEVPPGISSDEYAKSLIAIMANDYLSGAGSDTMLLKYIQQSYLEHGKPCFEDLKNIVIREISQDLRRGKGGRAGLWKETVQRIIQHLSIGASGEVLKARNNYPLPDLFNRNVVLEFGHIQSPRDRKFFIHLILNWLFLYLQHQGIESDRLKQCIIMEEFHNISMKREDDDFVSLMFRQVRKYGVALIALSQSPDDISNSIYGNMNTKIAFSLATAKDISGMAKAMNMTSQSARYLAMLDTGYAIANVRQRYPEPFLLKIPFTGHHGSVPDEMLSRSTIAEKTKHDNFRDSTVQKQDFNPQPHQGHVQSVMDIDTQPPLAPLEKVFLSNVIKKPFDGVRDRIKTIGIHPSEAVALQESLSTKGYIETAYIDRKKLIDLTSEGKRAAKSAGLIVPKKKTRGGLEHYYWITRTCQFLKKLEFKPVTEAFDIDISDSGQGLAIEIETGKSDIMNNLVKLEKSRFLRRFVLATNKPAEFKVKHLLLDFPTIIPMHVSDFFKLDKAHIINPSSHRIQPTKKRLLQITNRSRSDQTSLIN